MKSKNYNQSTSIGIKRWLIAACLLVSIGYGAMAQQCIQIACPQNMNVNADPGQCSAIVNYAPPTLTLNCCAPPTSVQYYTYLGTFNGHTYFQSIFENTWQNAVIDATTAGGKLVSINSAAENAFLQSVVTVNDAYIGGFQNPSNPGYSEPGGGWEWQDGTPFNNYTNWAPGEPNNDLGNEDVIEFQNTGLWNDEHDNFTLISLIEFGCNVSPVLISGLPSGSAFPIGTTTITFQASDDSGHVATCSFDVTVNGNTNLSISCPSDITINTDAGQCNASGVNLGTPVITANCSGTNAVATNNAPSVFPVGTTDVTWTATDDQNHTATCVQHVTVIDNQPPVLTCHANIIVNADPGFCTAVVNYTLPVISENCCSTPTSVQYYTYLGSFNGHTYFQSIFENNWQNSNIDAMAAGGQLVSINSAAENAFLQSVVTVNDAYIGGFQNHSNPGYSEPNGGWEWVDGTPFNNYTNWAAGEPNNDLGSEDAVEFQSSGNWNDEHDNFTFVSLIEFGCNNTPILVSGLPSGSAFPAGTTTVTYQVTDAAGNVGSCSFDITVIGNQAISINCPADVTVNTNTNQCSASNVALGNPVVAASCTDSTSMITVTNNAPVTFPIGTTNVTWTASNGPNNIATCVQHVIVVDHQAPVPNVSVLPNITSQCSATAAAPTATDNCSGLIIATTGDPLTYNTQGTFTIHWTYTDSNGNSSTQNQTVIVHDVTAPVPNVATLPNVTGQCTATATAPQATDNCTGIRTGTTSDPLTYNAEGTYTIHWTYSDGNGNTSTQNQTVIIHDNTPPVITGCPGNITSSSQVVSWTPPTATDNCSSLTFTHSHNPGATFPVGNTLVTYTANDGHGNLVTCSFTVTVTAPCSFTLTVTASATNVCSGSGVTLTAAGANSYSWNNGVINGVSFIPPVGTTAYAVTGTTTGGCTKTASITITVNALPAVPGGNDASRCGAGRVTLNATVGTGETVDWFATATGGSALATGTLSYQTPSISSTTTYYAQARKTATGCTSSARKAIKANISLSTPSTPGAISGPVYGMCNVTGKVYSIAAVSGALSYSWSVPNGATITAGQGTTQITVSFGGSFGCGSSGQVEVRSVNACGTSCTSSLNVYTHAATPGNISGPAYGVCSKTGQVYSIAAVAGATSYTWTVPYGVSIVGGNTTFTTASTSITVNFGSAFTGSGNVTVKANNACGSTTTICYAVYARPDMPSSITGSTSVCHYSNVVYSIAPVFGATSYSWTVPNGAYVSAGQGTGTVTVHFGSCSGYVSVKVNNACGSSSYKTKYVNITCRETETLGSVNVLNVFPNPSNGNVNVNFGLDKDATYMIHVIDPSGRIVKSISEKGISGQNIKTLDFSNLAKGVYVLVLESNDQHMRTTLIIQ